MFSKSIQSKLRSHSSMLHKKINSCPQQIEQLSSSVEHKKLPSLSKMKVKRDQCRLPLKTKIGVGGTQSLQDDPDS